MQGNSDLDVPERQRAVSLLGNRAVEEAIEEELLDRFPVDLFPFDIRIVGESMGGAAMVHITNVKFGLDECRLVEFSHQSGRVDKAAILAAVTNLISQCQNHRKRPQA